MEQQRIASGIVPRMRVLGRGRVWIGTVDAVFADYLLVRTRGLMPVDLYVPRMDATTTGGDVRVEASPREAYERWHRPLKQAPHD